MATNPLSNSQGVPPSGIFPAGTPANPESGAFVQAATLVDNSGLPLGTAGAASITGTPASGGVSQAAGSSAAANGATVDLGRVCAWTDAAVTVTGTLTAGSVQLQGSLDNVNFFNIGAAVTFSSISAAGTYAITAAGVGAAAGSVPARYVRLAITVALVGGTILATVGGA